MNIFSLFIFGIVLLLYLHIFYQLKTSNDKEIYDVQDVTKEKLEEICDLRQPALFNYSNNRVVDKTREVFSDVEGKYKNLAMNIHNSNIRDENNMVELTFENSKKLFKDDKKGNYTTYDNEYFLQKTKLQEVIENTDTYLKPALSSYSTYDICLGSDDASDPLKYEVNYRNFISVIAGSVKIKLFSPNKAGNLYENKDYHKFKFTSPINPWQVQPKYKKDIDLMEQMDVTVSTGRTIFIPAYWWYSIQYKKNSIVCLHKYRTYMNDLAILPKLIKHFLQSHNVKHRTIPVVKQESNINIEKSGPPKKKRKKEKEENKEKKEKKGKKEKDENKEKKEKKEKDENKDDTV